MTIDTWTGTGQNRKYSSIKMYKTICARAEPNKLFTKIWKTANRLRHKIFFWLLLHDRVNTRNLLNRKNMFLESYDCVFCNEHSEETLRHLFQDCVFTQECWKSTFPSKKPGISSYDDIMLIYSLLPKGIALEIIIQGCWRIWTQRNGKIFRKEVPSINCWKYRLKEDLQLLQYRIKAKYKDVLLEWIAAHL